MISGFIIALIGEIFLIPILTILGASSEVLPYSSDYMRVIFIGTPFVISSMVLNNFIRANGQPKLAMLTMFLGAGTNLILDPLFIYVFNMGMFGAALATIISQIVSFIWTVSYFINNNNPHKLDKLEEYYLNHNWKTIYKDKETLMVSYEEDDTQIYEYNIHTFDNSKAELAIIVSVGATRKVLEDELFNMLKEAKSFIKK